MDTNNLQKKFFYQKTFQNPLYLEVFRWILSEFPQEKNFGSNIVDGYDPSFYEHFPYYSPTNASTARGSKFRVFGVMKINAPFSEKTEVIISRGRFNLKFPFHADHQLLVIFPRGSLDAYDMHMPLIYQTSYDFSRHPRPELSSCQFRIDVEQDHYTRKLIILKVFGDQSHSISVACFDYLTVDENFLSSEDNPNAKGLAKIPKLYTSENPYNPLFPDPFEYLRNMVALSENFTLHNSTMDFDLPQMVKQFYENPVNVNTLTENGKNFIAWIFRHSRITLENIEDSHQFFVNKKLHNLEISLILTILMIIRSPGSLRLMFSLMFYYNHIDEIMINEYLKNNSVKIDGLELLTLSKITEYSDAEIDMILPVLEFSKIVLSGYYYQYFNDDMIKKLNTIFKFYYQHVENLTEELVKFSTQIPVELHYPIFNNPAYFDSEERYLSVLNFALRNSIDVYGYQISRFQLVDISLMYGKAYNIDKLIRGLLIEKFDLEELLRETALLIYVFTNTSLETWSLVIDHIVKEGYQLDNEIWKVFYFVGSRYQHYHLLYYYPQITDNIASLIILKEEQSMYEEGYFPFGNYTLWAGAYMNRSNEYPANFLQDLREEIRLTVIRGEIESPQALTRKLLGISLTETTNQISLKNQFSLRISSETTHPYRKLTEISHHELEIGEYIGSGATGEVMGFKNQIVKKFTISRAFSEELVFGSVIANNALSTNDVITFSSVSMDTIQKAILMNRGKSALQANTPQEQYNELSPSANVDVRKKRIFMIARGLFEMMSAGLNHMDIKPENTIMFIQDDNQVFPKIIDYGGSILNCGLKDHEPSTYSRGTIFYNPPEHDVYFKQFKFNPEKFDIWALGCLFYSYISSTGNHPYVPSVVRNGKRSLFEPHLHKSEELFTQIRFYVEYVFQVDLSQFYPKIYIPKISGKLPMDLFNSLRDSLFKDLPSLDCENLLRGMLDVNWETRFGINEVLTAPYFREYNFPLYNFRSRHIDLHWQLGQSFIGKRSQEERRKLLFVLEDIYRKIRIDRRIIYQVLRIYELINLPVIYREDLYFFLLTTIAYHYPSNSAINSYLLNIVSSGKFLDLYPPRELDNSFQPLRLEINYLSYDKLENFQEFLPRMMKPSQITEFNQVTKIYNDFFQEIIRSTDGISYYLSPYDIARNYYDKFTILEEEFIRLLNDCYLNGVFTIFNSCQIAAGIILYLNFLQFSEEIKKSPVLSFSAEIEYSGRIFLIYIKEKMRQREWISV